jgi:putative hydrolase
LLEAVGRSPLPAVLAHPLSILPKLGLRETQVPQEWLRALAGRCRVTGAALEVNEKWACPGVDVARLFHAEGVRLVAGSDAHRASAVGRWTTVDATLSAVLGRVDDPLPAPVM